MTETIAEKTKSTPEQLSKWMTSFCEGNYSGLPQHVFWEIEEYLRNSVPRAVADEPKA